MKYLNSCYGSLMELCLCLIFIIYPLSEVVSAQSESPSLEIVKTLESEYPICPGDSVEVRIVLRGADTAEYSRVVSHEGDLMRVFKSSAEEISNVPVATNIVISEIFGDCPGGYAGITDIIPDSWNIPPTVIPGDPPVYQWSLDELLIDDGFEIRFMLQVDPDAVPGFYLLECPDSTVSYIDHLGQEIVEPIPDPGFYYCMTPTPGTPGTPGPTATPVCAHTGDVNQVDGITTGDAQLAFQIALGYFNPTYPEYCAADCNGNGEITSSDAQQIFSAVFGGVCVDPL